MDATTTIYASLGLAAGALALVIWAFFHHRSKMRSNTNGTLLEAIIERQSPSPGIPRPHRSVPNVHRATGSLQNPALEGHLRTAILSADARERLIADAMRSTGGSRTAAIRKVLSDLHGDDKRWS
jgi:hypothetical protein